MYKLTQPPSPQKLSVAEAKQFLEMNVFPGQRGLSTPKARYYADLLLQGRLRPVDVALATMPDGTRVLMNGQHVCTACVMAGREMSAVVTRWKCETNRDAWELYATFDVHASRTVGHVFQGARGLLTRPEMREVPLRILQNCSGALKALSVDPISFHLSGPKSDRVAIVEDNSADVLWVNRMVTAEHVSRVGCIAAMLATHRKNPAMADDFWDKIASGIGFKSKSEPQKRVHDFLSKDAPSGNSRQAHTCIYAICVTWWNSWRLNEPRNTVKFASMKEIPEVEA